MHNRRVSLGLLSAVAAGILSGATALGNLFTSGAAVRIEQAPERDHEGFAQRISRGKAKGRHAARSCGAAALKRAARKRRNIRARSSKRR